MPIARPHRVFPDAVVDQTYIGWPTARLSLPAAGSVR